MRRPVAGGFAAPILLVGAGALALGSFVAGADRQRGLTEDERDYLAAASNLARHGVFSAAPPSETRPAADAYREPGYPALLALSWRLADRPPPATRAELEAFARDEGALGATRALHALLLLATAVGAGALVARLSNGTGGALAFALVAASPALQASARLVAAENLAAPLLVAATWALVAATRGGAGAACGAGAVFGVLAVVRASGSVAIAAGALLLALAPAPPGGASRWRRVALFLAAACLPLIAWQLRNVDRLGRAVSTDRGGLALAVRAELDREIERHGALAAALAWTPLEAARAEAERRAPAARFDRPIWTGDGNFYSRVVGPWRAERAGGGDSLALDRRLRAEALAAFAERPGAHLAATAAVGWRALFVERSPAWTTPIDLRLLFGLLLGAAWLGVTVAAVAGARAGDARLAALLVPASALFVAHALATEFLPRYALPMLPVAWSIVALLVTGGAGPFPRRAPRSGERTRPPAGRG